MYTLKKSPGQHFLRDENISRKIVDALRHSLSAPGMDKPGGSQPSSTGSKSDGSLPTSTGDKPGGSPFPTSIPNRESIHQLLGSRTRRGSPHKIPAGAARCRFQGRRARRREGPLPEANYPALKGKLIHASILDLDKPFTGRFTVIGNFPYNISTQILF
ncbi:hypothetical protein ACQ86N_41325 [Puia sp. P3]|uniref:hypothetical protein n=1 Tax=Puia sp. P3 TaxID=3423952 RepID=UPI003D677991